MGNRRKIRKIGIWLLIFLLSLGVIFALTGSPDMTAEMAFRMKEKQNLIGPASIMDVIDFTDDRYDHLLVGCSEYGYTFFEWNDYDPEDGALTYQPKSEGATIYCTKYSYNAMNYGQGYLPIFAFTDRPAFTARLVLTTEQDGEAVSYPLAAQRNGAGYFLFTWPTDDLRSRDFWMVQQMITGEYSNYVLDGTVKATLELYDANGELMETYYFSK